MKPSKLHNLLLKDLTLDLPLPVSLAIRLTLAFLISAGILWLTKSKVMMVLSLPVWGVLLAKPVIETLETYFDYARKQPWQQWQGHYYEFQRHHIRIFEEDGALWFCDVDIFASLGLKRNLAICNIHPERKYKKLDGTKLKFFSEEAVVQVVKKINHPETSKLLFWLTREVILPHHNKKKNKTRLLAGTYKQ